ncbi:MAG TPA: cation diffusion facilitator family transporter [Gaiellaceae bacterium]|nr:cation diffusion facilitator family transporter [Gaiellaceae bacterium]HET8653147.1 cation diffusion facilitator family transporter [Gaiellaceae bacterium]
MERASALSRPGLGKLLWLSAGAAVLTIALKMAAWQLTGSVGLLSDALESIVNLVAALVAIAMLHWASTPPDEQHLFGHEKAEYFSAGVEGGLIVLAAVSIAWTAIGRLINPVTLDDLGIGVALSAAASAVNLAVALILIRAGKRARSMTVEADGRHLLTDVWTSVGVIAGVVAVGVTGWRWLDPTVALLVALNIVVTGTSLLRRAGAGLMDHALPPEELEALEHVLDRYRSGSVSFHAVRTRQAGRRSFVSMHVLVPGAWSVGEAHVLADRLEGDVRAALPGASVTTHVEPVEDPASLSDIDLDRTQP